MSNISENIGLHEMKMHEDLTHVIGARNNVMMCAMTDCIILVKRWSRAVSTPCKSASGDFTTR